MLERGDAFALGPFPPVADDADPARRLWPGALIELAAEGIGTLRNRLGPAEAVGPRAASYFFFAAFRAVPASTALRASRAFFFR